MLEEEPDRTPIAQTASTAFTLFCYNILSDKYASPTAYSYTPSWVLQWDYRKELLMSEIMNYASDIVCLQEVENSIFEEHFKGEMAALGDYDGVFFPKSRFKTMDDAQRRGVDGCATFFKRSRWVSRCSVRSLAGSRSSRATFWSSSSSPCRSPSSKRPRTC